MDREQAQTALDDVARQRVAMVDRAMPWWVSVMLAVVLGGFFVIEGSASPAVVSVLTTVFWLGFLGVLVGLWWRVGRERRAKLASALVPATHRVRAAAYGAAIAVLVLIGVLGHDVLGWRSGLVVYGLVSGSLIATAGWWLRARLHADLGADPTVRPGRAPGDGRGSE